VLDFDLVNFTRIDGISEDTLLLAWQKLFGQPLPPGNDAVVDLYVTGTRDGSILVDSCFFPPAANMQFRVEGGPASPYVPAFEAGELPILMGTLPPEFTMPGDRQVMANRLVTFSVSATSPEGFELEISLFEITRLNDPGASPVASPVTTGVNPLQFSWTPDSTDMGVWETTFEGCNPFGACDSAIMSIQVIGESDVNDDGLVNLTDITELVNWLFLEGPEPSNSDAGDVNRSGVVNLTDVTLIVNCLFLM
jgi:hypothetical protein